MLLQEFKDEPVEERPYDERLYEEQPFQEQLIDEQSLSWLCDYIENGPRKCHIAWKLGFNKLQSPRSTGLMPTNQEVVDVLNLATEDFESDIQVLRTLHKSILETKKCSDLDPKIETWFPQTIARICGVDAGVRKATQTMEEYIESLPEELAQDVYQMWGLWDTEWNDGLTDVKAFLRRFTLDGKYLWSNMEQTHQFEPGYAAWYMLKCKIEEVTKEEHDEAHELPDMGFVMEMDGSDTMADFVLDTGDLP